MGDVVIYPFPNVNGDSHRLLSQVRDEWSYPKADIYGINYTYLNCMRPIRRGPGNVGISIALIP